MTFHMSEEANPLCCENVTRDGRASVVWTVRKKKFLQQETRMERHNFGVEFVVPALAWRLPCRQGPARCCCTLNCWKPPGSAESLSEKANPLCTVDSKGDTAGASSDSEQRWAPKAETKPAPKADRFLAHPSDCRLRPSHRDCPSANSSFLWHFYGALGFPAKPAVLTETAHPTKPEAPADSVEHTRPESQQPAAKRLRMEPPFSGRTSRLVSEC